MNINITDAIFDAIGVASPNEWKHLFQTMRQTEFERVRVVPENELTGLQSRVILLDEVEELFLRIRGTPESKQKQ